MKKKKWSNGGYRPGSGRKKEPNPKIGLTIYVRTDIINEIGGVEPSKILAANHLELVAEKIREYGKES